MSLTADTLAQAMGNTVSADRYRQLFPAANQALLDAGCTTVDRAAMWMAQVGHESGGLRWMEEIASGAAYEGRQDLGNTQPGDGVRYKGRGPIQITGRYNYTQVSQWAYTQGLVPTPTYFVDNPTELASDRYGFTGATWYWTIARPMNTYADNADILGATKAINGGTNGLDDRTQRWNRCRAMGNAILPTKPGENMPENMPARPDFNEYAIWSPNHYPTRQGNNPYCFLLHTQEPPENTPDALTNDNAADDLARNVLANPANQVAYHYSISQARDGGVTVVDCVDTDQPSWSVGDANNISINLCFAGSRARWTRQQWLKQAKAIDVAAYLAVQDCQKYGMSTLVVPPPYTAGKPGISDHNWVTKVFGWGDHTDVGPNFPWDIFAAAVNKYAGTTPAQPPAPQPQEPAVDALTPKQQADLYNTVMGTAAVAADNQRKLQLVLDQLGPGFDAWGEDGDLGKNAKDQRRTLRAGLAALMRKVGA